MISLIASGDSRLSANQQGWPVQAEMESALISTIQNLGYKIERAHKYCETLRHGFISSQRQGMDIFRSIDENDFLIVAESVWQYSHHVYPGLYRHKGPIMTIGNWSGQWPGLVGLLNLNACLTKAGIEYSTLWVDDFAEESFVSSLRLWLEAGKFNHDISHVTRFALADVSNNNISCAERLVEELQYNRAIIGVFDEGCMGMFNAIIPDHMIHPLGVFKERLSQSALLAEMSTVNIEEAESVYDWIVNRGFTFKFGNDPAYDLTRTQVIEQCRMYIAACRIGDRYGCDAIGIQYQLGLKDMCCASDLVEGLLNNSDRPPVFNESGREIKAGEPYIHFNEVDECAALDAILINKVNRALGQPLETTLHDLRWGDWDRSGSVSDYVWVLEISGAAPAAHHIGGYRGSVGERQPTMYFPKGGSTLSGVAKPGEIVWSRIYVRPDGLSMDIGRGTVVALTDIETERRRNGTTPQWPIMHCVLHGVTRDQMMAKHQSNHIQVVYAIDSEAADRCLEVRAAVAAMLGIDVNLCGVNISS